MAAIAETERRPRSSRLPVVLGVVAAVAIGLAAIAAFILYRTQAGGLVGTDLSKTPAPGFALVDQNGQQVSLAQFRGKPVVLTFLYTQCTDSCPLIADQLHQTTEQLGADASKIGILAVSTDPRHDDRAAAVNFTQQHSMTGRWHYLIGSPSQLTPIWKDYYIGVSPTDGSVTHSNAIFVLDKAGNERALLGVPFRAQDLASDLRTLLSE